MRTILLVAAATLPVAALSAQACSGTAPPTSLSTIWASTTFAGSPSATVGSNFFFNMTINADISISRIDVNVTDAGTPNLVGQVTTLQLWITPTTYVGAQMNQPIWTQIGTGTLTVAAPDADSIATFAPPVLLTAGTYGVALTHIPTGLGPLHPLYTNPTVSPIPSIYSDQYMTIDFSGAGNVQQTAWTGGVGALRIMNCEIHYTPSAAAGYSESTGPGCYNRPKSFYEVFPAGGGVDLSPGAIQLSNLGPNYLVTPSAAGYTAPTGGQINIPGPSVGVLGPFTAVSSTAATTPATEWDDALSIPMALPASWGAGGFPYPGGSTTVIQVSSNGHVFLQPSVETFGFYSDITRFLNDSPRLCMMWGDLDGSVAGASINVETAPADAYVQVSWHQVPEWATVPTGNPFNMQLRMYPSGVVEYIYGNAVSWTVGGAPAICGFSFGGGLGGGDPGNRDISATMPFTSGDGAVPAVLSMSARPRINSTPNIVTSNFTGTNMLFAGFTSSPGIDLGFLGMPGCPLWLGLAPSPVMLSLGFASPHTVPFAIPNNPGFAGIVLHLQAAQIVPVPLNPAGINASNGMCMRVGQ